MSDEFSRNGTLMKRCTKVYNFVAMAYIISCGSIVIVSLGMMILSVFRIFIGPLFDGVICKAAIMAAGYLGVYKKDTMIAILAPCAAGVNLIIDLISGISTGTITVIILLLSAALALVTAIANSKYHYLEGQAGFPYFNERVVYNEMERRQSDIKSEYEQSYEKRKKTSSDQMDDL